MTLLAGLGQAAFRWLAEQISPHLPAVSDLEDRMSKAEDALVELDAATNEVAAELEAALASGEVADAAVADRITAAATRLRSLAADPDNPVPAGPEAPGDAAPVSG